MPRKKCFVTLTADERMQLEQLLRGGQAATRKVTCARILLKAAEGCTRQIRQAKIADRVGKQRRCLGHCCGGGKHKCLDIVMSLYLEERFGILLSKVAQSQFHLRPGRVPTSPVMSGLR